MSDYLYGIHSVRHLLEAKPEVVLEISIDKNRQDKTIEPISKRAHELGLSVQYQDKSTLSKLVNSEQHQGVVAKYKPLPRYSEHDVAQLLEQCRQPACILILDGVQAPHNLGACLRTADGANVDFVIIPKDRACQITATVAKVASGALVSIPIVIATNLARTIRQLQQAGIWIYGTSDQAEKSLYQQDFAANVAIVLGSEGKGMRDKTMKLCDELMHIPMTGIVSSLNVSVATGVCLYEVIRQRS